MREHINFHDFPSLKDLQAENATQNQFQARGGTRRQAAFVVRLMTRMVTITSNESLLDGVLRASFIRLMYYISDRK